MENNQDGSVYSEQSDSKPMPTEAMVVKKKRSLSVFAIAVVVVIFAVATGYFLFIRSFAAKDIGQQEAWVEYANENGFAFSYPKNFSISETENGLSLTGEGELNFQVRDMESRALREVLGEEVTPETFTADSRTGYKVSAEDATYYFFPLFGDSYLEIADRGNGEAGEEIVSKLKFVAPQSASIN